MGAWPGLARCLTRTLPTAAHGRRPAPPGHARPRQPIGRWAPRPLLQKVFPEHLQSVFPLSGGDWAKTGGQGPCLSAACPWPEAGHSREGNGLCWAAGSGWTALWEEPEEEPLRPRFHHPCWEPCGRRPVAHLLAGRNPDVSVAWGTRQQWRFIPLTRGRDRTEERECGRQPCWRTGARPCHCWLVQVRAQMRPSLVPGEGRAPGLWLWREESAGRVPGWFFFAMGGLLTAAGFPGRIRQLALALTPASAPLRWEQRPQQSFFPQQCCARGCDVMF